MLLSEIERDDVASMLDDREAVRVGGGVTVFELVRWLDPDLLCDEEAVLVRATEPLSDGMRVRVGGGVTVRDPLCGALPVSDWLPD